MSRGETQGIGFGHEFFGQPCEVVSRESPIEGRGHGLVVLLEAQQSVLDVFDAGKVIGSECFALDDGEVDLNLVKPTGVGGTMDGNQVGKDLRQAPHAGLPAMRGAVIHDPEHAAGVAIRRLGHDSRVRVEDSVLTILAHSAASEFRHLDHPTPIWRMRCPRSRAFIKGRRCGA